VSNKALLRRFDAWRREGRTLVLATVVGTAGSTYTKAGHRMLIADSGDYQGLVSGGCLEGDLAVHAGEVISSGDARVITYDLRGENEELFGLGIGCDGLLRILLQRLEPASDYEPFASIAQILSGDRAEPWSTSLPDGTTLQTTLHPLPRLLVLGAGPDAEPVVTLADLLGWRVTLIDHRPAYLERPAFAVADARVCAPADELAAAVPLAGFAAAVVMSHHLASDRSYLRALAPGAIPYIGLLGPPGRRERLLRELGEDARGLTGRLHGPAGLDIGADSPESIALSILSEIHALARPRP